MAFQFDFLIIASIVKTFPDILITFLGDVHLVKISNYTLIYIVSTVHKEGVAEYNSNMIGSTANILALYLDLGPSIVECIL